MFAAGADRSADEEADLTAVHKVAEETLVEEGAAPRLNRRKVHADQIYYPAEGGLFFPVASMPDMDDFLLVERQRETRIGVCLDRAVPEI